MNFSVYNENLQQVSIFSTFTSIVWEEEVRGKGALQLVLPKTSKALSTLTIKKFIKIPNRNTLMYIYGIEDKDNELWVYGHDAKYLLNSKLYHGTARLNGYIESKLRNLFTEISPYSFMELGTNHSLTDTGRGQKTYASMFEMASEWCSQGNLGFKCDFDKTTSKLKFEVYKGTTRSNLKFSTAMGNLKDVSRIQSETTFANVAYVAGAGEGEERTIVTVGSTSTTNLNRKEIYIDARDIQPDEEETQEEYEARLEARGIEKLADMKMTDDISFTIQSNDFESKFYLGDIIPVTLTEYGQTYNLQVTGFKKVFEDNIESTEIYVGG